MEIIIKADDTVDKDTLQAFCHATGWTQASPLTKKQWMAKEAAKWIVQKARMGLVNGNVTTIREQYSTAVRAAMAEANTSIPQPTTGTQ